MTPPADRLIDARSHLAAQPAQLLALLADQPLAAALIDVDLASPVTQRQRL